MSDGARDQMPERIAGYRIVERIGAGSGGIVYRAIDEGRGQTVALKVLSGVERAAAGDAEALRRLVDAAGRLRHRNIVPVYGCGEVGGRAYVVTGWVDGVALDELLEMEIPDVAQALEVLEKVARALEYAHAGGIVHRDLKPANIIVDTDGEPRVNDFGLARLTTGGPTETGALLVGTPCYMAPEQAGGHGGEVDGRADIYSLGCILYEVLAGERPFDGRTVEEILRKQVRERPVPPGARASWIPRELEAVCMKCLEKKPSRRYQSAGELADDLRRLLDGHDFRKGGEA